MGDLRKINIVLFVVYNQKHSRGTSWSEQSSVNYNFF